MPKPYIATPCYGGNLKDDHVRSIQEFLLGLQRAGAAFERAQLAHESHVERARNELLAAFLLTDCDVLAFIDADIAFRPQDAADMLNMGLDFSVGPYLKKTIPPEWTIRPLPGSAKARLARRPQDGAQLRFLEVEAGGGGFLFLSRAAVERLVADVPRYRGGTTQRPIEIVYDVFRRRGPMGEDFALCERWRDLGGQVWCNIDAKLTHVGDCNYAGDFAAHVALAPVDEDAARFK